MLQKNFVSGSSNMVMFGVNLNSLYGQRSNITQMLHLPSSHCKRDSSSSTKQKSPASKNVYSNLFLLYEKNVQLNRQFRLDDIEWAKFQKCRQESENSVLSPDVSNGVQNSNVLFYQRYCFLEIEYYLYLFEWILQSTDDPFSQF